MPHPFRSILGRVAILMTVFCCLTACAPPQKSSDRLFLSSDFAAPDPSFRRSDRLLTDFQATQSEADFTRGDWVLLGVKISHREAEGVADDVWFVRLSTLTPSEAATDAKKASEKERSFVTPFNVGPIKAGRKHAAEPQRVCVEVYDRDGDLLRSSIRTTPKFASTFNLLDVCRLLQPVDESAPAAPVALAGSPDDLAGMLLTLRAEVCCGATESIRQSMRDHVVRAPTLVEVVLNALRLSVQTNITEAGMVMPPWSLEGGLAPAYQCRFPVCFAGQKLFDCRMIAGPALPPFQLTGGMLLAEAVHPDKPDNRMMIRILAARHPSR